MVLRHPCTNETRCGFAKSAVRLAELKQRVERARQQAVASVNRELVVLYWQIGRDILDRQRQQGWGPASSTD
jgi:DUF1016 N-terminal domain